MARHAQFCQLTVFPLLVLLLASCKDTEGYLSDLKTAHDPGTGRLNLQVYDAGQLVHEGLTGIMDQEVLTLAQMGRAVHFAGKILELNEVPLCRADAIALLVHVALRYPLPSLEVPFLADKKVGGTALEQIELLEKAFEPLEVDGLLAGLSNPDAVVAEEHYHRLRELTGQTFPQAPEPWTNWWNITRAEYLARAESEAREPLQTLTFLDYRGLGSARVVLGYLSARLALHELPGLRTEMETAVVRLSRQVVVLGIVKSLTDEDPTVRSEAARAAGKVLDPAFRGALLTAYGREADTSAKVPLLKTLAFYPGRSTMMVLLAALDDRDRAVRLHARKILGFMSGQDHGETASGWRVWWERDGKNRWP